MHSPTARPGDGSVRTRKVALLVADGVQGEQIAAIQAALLAEGAVGRLVGPRIGPFRTAEGETMEADASLENEPGFLFDALVLPDGAEGVELLFANAHTEQFIKDQFLHGKTILALGASATLLAEAKIPETLPSGDADPGVLRGTAENFESTIEAFVAALARHRHPAREIGALVVDAGPA